MVQLLLPLLLCALAVNGARGEVFPNMRHPVRDRLQATTTTTTTEPPVIVGGRHPLRDRLQVTTTTTTEPPTTTTERRPSIIINNNVPTVGNGCTLHFECKKKLKVSDTPKPCLKYCVKNVECPGETKVRGQPNDCFELLEDYVTQEYNAQQANGTVKVMEVAMIDFPCQPGYLPDHRGRCREIW